jgi:hypothetical protein
MIVRNLMWDTVLCAVGKLAGDLATKAERLKNDSRFPRIADKR